MHQTLSALPKRALPDTNVFLDAAFVADGLARNAIAALASLGTSIILSDGVESEAVTRLQQLKRRLALNFDPVDIFQRYLATIPLLRVPPADPSLGCGVNRSDQHVVAAARQYGTWILTGDVPLVVEAQKVGVPGRLPWDVYLELARKQGRYEDIGNVIRVRSPSQQTGLIFARVLPGSWRNLRNVGQFTVCEIQNAGRIYYDTHQADWVFDLVTGDSVRVPWSMAGDGWLMVCGTYRLSGLDSGSLIRLRASGEGQDNRAIGVKTAHRLTAANSGTISFGHAANGEHNWNGHIRSIVVGPQGLSNETWKALTCIPESAPNPFDSNALEPVLRILDRHCRGLDPTITAISEHHLQDG